MADIILAPFLIVSSGLDGLPGSVHLGVFVMNNHWVNLSRGLL